MYTLRESALTSGQLLHRPYRGRPMFAGVLHPGFQGDWITHNFCIECGSTLATAGCGMCQAGIC
eukprot:685459-Lingulodinium_polyedra.AAC.1